MKAGNGIRAGRDTARLNVELMQLDRAVPGVPGWGELPAPAPDPARLQAFFEKYELHRLAPAAEAPAATPPPKPAPAAPKPDGQMNLF